MLEIDITKPNQLEGDSSQNKLLFLSEIKHALYLPVANNALRSGNVFQPVYFSAYGFHLILLRLCLDNNSISNHHK